MIIKLLGTGSWEGIPALGCTCKICHSARANPKNMRNRPALLIKSKEDSPAILIECGPDIRFQYDYVEKPDTILISHYHFDHMAGLPELHTYTDLVLKNKIEIKASVATIKEIDRLYPYLPLDKTSLHAFKTIELYGLKITPFPVYHMNSLDKGGKDLDKLPSLGFKVEYENMSFVYTGDFYDMPVESKELIAGADVLLTDGTYLFEDKYKTDYAKAIKDERDPDHLHSQDIIDFAKSTKSSKVIYHSISHLSGLDQGEMQALLPKGHFIFSDEHTIVI